MRQINNEIGDVEEEAMNQMEREDYESRKLPNEPQDGPDHVKDEPVPDEEVVIEDITEEKEEVPKVPKQLTFGGILRDLNEEQFLVTHLFSNLSAYCAAAKAKIEKEPELLQLPRSKMFLVSKKHSHEEEI